MSLAAVCKNGHRTAEISRRSIMNPCTGQEDMWFRTRVVIMEKDESVKAGKGGGIVKASEYAGYL